MVDPEKIEGMLRNLREYGAILNSLKSYTREDFLADINIIGSAKYHLIATIECCIDIANHIISSETFRAPQDYKDVFRILAENKIITEDFEADLEKMAGFRNRLVHLYWKVDNERVYEILHNNLDDFEIFSEYILRFMNKT